MYLNLKLPIRLNYSAYQFDGQLYVSRYIWYYRDQNEFNTQDKMLESKKVQKKIQIVVAKPHRSTLKVH